MEDLNKIEEFNPFSEKSKELITMGNTEYFELCEIYAAVGKESIVEQSKIRRLVNSQLR